jgi:hypothetical protein
VDSLDHSPGRLGLVPPRLALAGLQWQLLAQI